MAIQRIGQDTSLGIAKDFIVDGKPKTTVFSYSNVKPDATDQNVYNVGLNFGNTLMDGALSAIERTDTNKLISM